MPTFDHFYDLPVYKTCREFKKNLIQIVASNFPTDEKYLLSKQILRSSRSVTANIAEGFGRFHY